MSRSEETPGTGIPSYRYASGWYCVGWSDELAPGDVRAIRYFGQDLVMFRGHSGAAHVMDTHCLHLGGNLAHGGCVREDRIVCPWHGWHWNGDGTHALTPYSELKQRPELRIRSWPLREWYGMILVWHHRHDRAPEWEPPRVPEAERDDFYPLHPHTRMVHRVRAHPQMIVENAADPYHVGPVHHGAATQTTSFCFEKHHLHATIRTVYGAGRESTWLTPAGPVEADVVYDTWGLGIGFVRFPREVIESVQITSHTPIDDEYTAYWFMQTMQREPGDSGARPSGRARRFLELQQAVVQQDFPIWEHMKYLDRPNFAPEEAPDYLGLRHWARQFYPPESLWP